MFILLAVPQNLQISTPIANAGPEGTEFAMRVDENKAYLWVYEGQVKFSNDQGLLRLLPDQGAVAERGLVPRVQIDIKPQDAVNWALYYPTILAYPDASRQINATVLKAIDEFRHNRIDSALALLETVSTTERQAYFYKVRSAIRLSVGLTDLALQDIQQILSYQAADADALAIKAILLLSQNQKQAAFDSVSKSFQADNQSPTAYSALSYVEQARFDLPKALLAAEQAAKYAPTRCFGLG